MKQKNIFIASAVVLIVGFVIGAILYTNQRSEQANQTAAKNQTALVRAHSPTIGNADAPVHIVEFFDPACGTCAEFYPLVKKLMASNPGKIKVSLRYAPFHKGSDQVVKLLEAARKQGKHRPTLEALFANQSAWVQNHTANIDLVWGVLDGLNLDMDQLKRDMSLPDTAQLIEQDLADAKTLNVTMTPEFFVNGKPLPNFGFEELKKLIDDALASTGKN
jgi:protein-disulfide isomerase